MDQAKQILKCLQANWHILQLVRICIVLWPCATTQHMVATVHALAALMSRHVLHMWTLHIVMPHA